MSKQLRAWIAVMFSFFAGASAAELVAMLEQRSAAPPSQETAAPRADDLAPARVAAAVSMGGSRIRYEAHE